MVHLPFYLQNSGLRKVKVAQKSAQSHRKSVTVQPQYESQPETTLAVSVSEAPICLFDIIIGFFQLTLTLTHRTYIILGL